MEIKKKTFYKILGTFIVILGIVLFITLNPGNGGNGNGSFEVFKNTSLFPSIGPENVKTVIEFSDFQCPWCAIASGLPEWAKSAAETNPNVAAVLGASENAKKLAKEGKIKFIYVSMSFVGKESVNAAEAGLCANEQGKFWKMHDAIFSADSGPEENDGTFTKENLEIIAQNISGLDQTKLSNCLKSSKMLSNVQEISRIASKFVSSTPTFFVDGKQVSSSWSEIEKYLD
ncbi:thioredoxin domain-containing protein [Candidatus Pacearchaeota archaeon]|nr:hypothetical protein [uncultured archaeon]MBS3084317.1 thioredoxin domain-containing protein [Candidatus Pacearchaeota archaeon]